MNLKELEDLLYTCWKNIDKINERTKKHTKDIIELRKGVKHGNK